MTTSEDFHDIAAMVQERLEAALALQAQAQADTPSAATAQDPERYVSATVDSRGVLTQVVFDRAIAELDEEQLRESTLAAVAAAQQQLTGPPTQGSPEAALHDTSVAEAYLALVNRSEGEGHGR